MTFRCSYCNRFAKLPHHCEAMRLVFQEFRILVKPRTYDVLGQYKKAVLIKRTWRQ